MISNKRKKNIKDKSVEENDDKISKKVRNNSQLGTNEYLEIIKDITISASSAYESLLKLKESVDHEQTIVQIIAILKAYPSDCHIVERCIYILNQMELWKDLKNTNQIVHDLFVLSILESKVLNDHVVLLLSKLVSEFYKDNLNVSKTIFHYIFTSKQGHPALLYNHSFHMFCLTVLDKILSVQPEAVTLEPDFQVAFAEVIDLYCIEFPDQLLDFIIMFCSIYSHKANYDRDELVLKLHEKFKEYETTVGLDVFKTTIFDLIKSDKLPIRVRSILNDLTSVTICMFEEEEFSEPIKLLFFEEYILMLFSFGSALPDNFDLEKYKESNGDFEDRPLASSAYSALSDISEFYHSKVMDIFEIYWKQHIHSDNWQLVVGLGYILIFIYKHCFEFIDDMKEDIRKMLKHPHFVVRVTFHTLLYQMFSENKDMDVDELLSYLQVLLELKETEPLVQFKALKSISGALDETNPEYIEPYIARICQAIEPALQTKNEYVLEGAVDALSSLFDILGEESSGYIEKYMPLFLNFLRSEKKANNLRGRAMEAISVLGTIIKDLSFDSVVVEAINIIQNIKNIDYETNEIDFIIRAMIRFAQRLGERFQPFMNFTAELLMTVITFDKHKDNIWKLKNQDSDIAENMNLAIKMIPYLGRASIGCFAKYIGTFCTEILRLLDSEVETIRAEATTAAPLFMALYKYNTLSNSIYRDSGSLRFGMLLQDRMKKSIELETSDSLLELKTISMQRCMAIAQIVGVDNIKEILDA